MQKITVITRLTRARASANGNPRWYVHLGDGTQYYTKPDAAVAYGLDNPEMKGLLEITIENGQIIYAQPVGYSLSDCVNWETNTQGDCGGRVEEVDGVVICETCRNRPKPAMHWLDEHPGLKYHRC